MISLELARQGPRKSADLESTNSTILIVDPEPAYGTAERVAWGLPIEERQSPCTIEYKRAKVAGLRTVTSNNALHKRTIAPTALRPLARKMSTDASSSTRPKRQLVKAACQSCQKRKVKVSSLAIWLDLSYAIDLTTSSSVVVSVLCVCSANREVKHASTIPKRVSQESKQ